MHSTGFFHEQSRADRDEYIKIVWSNVVDGLEGRYFAVRSIIIMQNFERESSRFNDQFQINLTNILLLSSITWRPSMIMVQLCIMDLRRFQRTVRVLN